MNLYRFYPHIYWQCACLTVNASANEESQDNSSTNYGKIATAISAMRHNGVRIDLPGVNKAGYGFRPDAENNSIVFGLKGISGIGDDLASQIVENAPYTSIMDFYQRINPSVQRMITLCKAGAFDTLPDACESRVETMKHMLSLIAEQAVENKPSLGLRNLNAIMKYPNFIPQKFNFASRLYLFRTYIRQQQFKIDKDTARLDTAADAFFQGEIITLLKEGTDYIWLDDGTAAICLKPFEKFVNSVVAPMKEWLSSEDTVAEFNRASKEAYVQEKMQSYCEGNQQKWEMDALSFYHGPHELEGVSTALYGVKDFNSLPEEPVVVETKKMKDREYTCYELSRIMGTVLDKNKVHCSVTLLTPTGVVTVKFYDGAFAHYSKQISQVDENGEKHVIEKPWLDRGNKLMICGFRRGDTFFPRKYRDSVYQHTVCLITDVFEDGTIRFKEKRADERKSYGN